MKSAAQLDLHPDLAPASSGPMPGPISGDELRQQAARRLAEHRARRAQPAAQPAPAPQPAAQPRSRKSDIAAAVAERYRNSPTYRSVLAEESERALHAAEAAAEVASINARAIARAQQQLLDEIHAELGGWQEPRQSLSSVPISSPPPVSQPSTAAAAAAILAQQQKSTPGHATPPRRPSPVAPQPAAPQPVAVQPAAPQPVATQPAADPIPSRDILSEDFATPLPALGTQQPATRSTPTYTVRLYEDAGRPTPPPPARPVRHELDPLEASLLDEEIAFRYDPVLTDAAPPEPIPANLIEFPRQLIAARKARPRLAEGPLRDEAELSDTQQLRIFEVEPEHISAAPADISADGPEWSSILLPAQPVTTFFEPLDTDYTPSLAPQAASFPRRLLAAGIDLTLIAVCSVAAVALFVLTATHLTHTAITASRLTAAGVLFGSLAALAAIYHLLFFTLSDSTPGMRYARIAFCTLSDENPTRAEVRRRLLAVSLSALPLGLGYVWAFFDEDGLGWHDRISRMYPRAY